MNTQIANFKTNIKATNYELTGEIREYINHQTSKFTKFMPQNTEEIILDVEVGKETKHHQNGPVYRAEFNIKYSGEFKRAESTQEDLKAAIDLAADELVRQIRKTKEKKKDRTRKGAGRLKRLLKFGRK
jgi:ribosomal subunit interface protein